jgi:TolB-like protein/Tfp pilus assembly protein PilF
MKKYNQPITSIAVLPFRNNTSAEDLNFFALGFVEDLITDLSKYSSLQVISSHSTAAALDERLVRSLNSDFIVTGSFRQNGGDLRINVQLILGEDQSVVWSHRYRANLDELFDIQDDVAEQIVSTLQREIDVNLLANSRQKPRTSLAAYEYWLMGMAKLKKGSIEADNDARALFQQALTLDPDYARAYAGLSLSYFNEWSCQLWERWDYSQKGAFEYAQKAVELDDTNYMSMTVLGRLYVYKGEWEKAEHFLRKSLRLNSNDTDNLIQIASCFIHLHYLKEAEKLYLKALRLNPIYTDWYYSFGGMLYFEMGEFEKSVEQGLKANLETVMVDMSAYIAGAYYYLGEYGKMAEYWKKYLDMFQRKILRGNALSEEEAWKWVKNVNPYKEKTNMTSFLEYIATQSDLLPEVPETQQLFSTVDKNIFMKSGPLWEITFKGNKAVVPDAKGLNDISKLLKQPGEEIHCSELMDVAVLVGDEELTIDDKAKKAYKDRLTQLQLDIEEAQLMNDSVRAGHLQEEMDKILGHLSGSLGLGGKSRKIPDQIDKARSAVTWRIRAAIKKVKESHEALGNHLSNSIRTGVFCSYQPENEIEWDS